MTEVATANDTKTFEYLLFMAFVGPQLLLATTPRVLIVNAVHDDTTINGDRKKVMMRNLLELMLIYSHSKIHNVYRDDPPHPRSHRCHGFFCQRFCKHVTYTY